MPPQDRSVARRIPDASCSRRYLGDRPLRRVLDVQPRREGAVAGAGDDHGPHVRVAAQAVEEAAELEPDLLGEGVQLLRAVDLDVGDVGGGGGDEEVRVVIALEGGHLGYVGRRGCFVGACPVGLQGRGGF